MAYFQPIYTYAFLLAVIACHQILLTQGRQLKSMKKQDFNHSVASKKNTFPPSPTQTLEFGNIEAGNVDDFRPTTPGNSPGVGHSFEEHNVDVEPEALGSGSTIASSLAGNTDDFRPTVPGNVDDFRPTTPGNSPGAGHSFEEHNVDVESEALGNGSTVGSSLAGNTDDFRPTDPGHSPGVGHSLQTKKTKPNA
ncbi:hypothetical protein LguiA_017540 [Lonicera macranthoides]